MHDHWYDEDEEDEDVDWCDECGAGNEYSCVCQDGW